MTDDEVKDFVDINFKEYVKSTKENRYSKLSEKQNLRKVPKSPCLSNNTWWSRKIC